MARCRAVLEAADFTVYTVAFHGLDFKISLKESVFGFRKRFSREKNSAANTTGSVVRFCAVEQQMTLLWNENRCAESEASRRRQKPADIPRRQRIVQLWEDGGSA